MGVVQYVLKRVAVYIAVLADTAKAALAAAG